VFAARVIEAVDVFEDGDLDLAAGLPVPAPDLFDLMTTGRQTAKPRGA